MKAKKDYYLTADGKVTEDAEKAERFLVRKGHFVPANLVEEYGFEDGEIKTESKKKAATENKKKKPAENKAKK